MFNMTPSYFFELEGVLDDQMQFPAGPKGVTWFLHMCDVSNSNVGDLTHSYMCDVTNSYASVTLCGITRSVGTD